MSDTTVRLFPDAPEDPAALSDEALSDLLASFQDVSRRLKLGEIDLTEAFGEDVSRAEASAEVMAQWREAAQTAQKIRAEIEGRQAGEVEFAAEAEELHAEFADDAEKADDEAAPAAEVEVEVEVLAKADSAEEKADDEDDDEDEDAKPDGDAATEEPEALAAAGTAVATRRVMYPAVPRNHRAEAEDGVRRAVLVAAAGLSDRRFKDGNELDSDSLAEAMIEIVRRRGPIHNHKDGGRERILVASADLPASPDRTLVAGDRDGNSAKIRAIGSPFFGEQEMETMLASGGLCAPAEPFYNLPQLSTTARPVRDALPAFRAARGAISVPSVSDLGDIDSAITVIEEEDDALGGTFATKSCQDMTCAEWTDVAVGAIAHCRTYGNLNARAWPEGIAHENGNTMSAWARTAEGRLLDRMDSLSLSLSRAAVYGLSSTLLYALQVSRAGIISRLRMNPATRFQAILPFWAAEAFSSDLVNSQYGRFDTPPEQVAALLSRFGFATTWHLDQGIAEGATTEVWADEVTDSTQGDWPGTTMIARVFPAGEFLYVDGGSFEVGIVRDSGLNHTNDHEVFGESWENLARIGPVQAAHRLAISVCPDGTVAAPDTSAFTCDPS